VPVHASDRENGFWDRYSGRDLVDATKLVAIQSTFRNFMVPMQFKQLSVKTQGVDERQGTTKSNQIKSPLDILTTNGDAQVLDWQSNLQQIGEQIQNQIFAIATNYGISAENFKLTAQAVSGFARKVARERLDEIREEQIKVWRRAEEQVFEAIKWATIVYDLDPIPEAAKIFIDFAEPKEFEDPQIEIDIKKQKVDLGVISLLDIVKEENPDVKTDDQAEELLRKNLEIRRRLTSRFGFDFENLLKTRGQQPQGAQNAG
jgi:predicted house-cleaning noncanonical NTP pyrophosphatase (MazG superfamily)